MNVGKLNIKLDKAMQGKILEQQELLKEAYEEMLDMNDYLATNQLTKREHDRIKRSVKKAEEYLKNV